MTWKELQRRITETREDTRIYFSEKQDEILTSNLHIFKNLSVICLLIMILYILTVGLFLSEWKITPFHFVMIIWIIVYIFIAFYINKYRLKHKALEKAVCISFGLCVFLLLICIDTISAPTSSQTFCSAYLVIAPVVFIMPASRMIIDQVFFVVIYALFAFRFKEHAIAMADMYAILAGLFFGIIAYLIIMDLRLRVNAEVIQLKHFSEIDELTKIKNRRAANAQISYMLRKRDEKSNCALIMLDVDFFKTINDTYGHHAGDQVLIEVADVLSKTFRKNDIVSRFGGDEFMVFIDGFKNEDFLKEKCQEVLKKVQDIREEEFQVSCSIGLCILTEGRYFMDEMIHAADQALYETKNRQRGTYSINVIH